MNRQMISRLVSLEAKLDSVLFAQEEEMPQKKRRGMGGVLAGTAAVGAGGMALRKRYGADQISGVGDQVRATMSGASREAGDMVGNVRAAGGRMKKYGGKVAGEVRRYAKGGFNTSAAKDIFRAVRRVKFSRSDQHLQELGARLDQVLEFAEEKKDVMKRLILGGPLASAMAAPKGQIFAQEEEMPQKKRRGMGGVLAGTAAVGAGGMALRKRYGADQISGVGDQVRATMSGASREAGDMVGNVRAAGGRMKKYGGKVAGEVRRYAKGGFNTNAAKDIFRAVRRVKFSRPDQHLQELGARLDQVLEFAEEKKDVMKRLILGGPLASAMAAPKGQKLTAAAEQMKYGLREQGKGIKKGTPVGAVAGAGLGVGLLAKRAKVLRKSAGRKAGAKMIGKAGLGGALSGAVLGSYVGGLKGSYGSNEIHQKAKRGELKQS